MKLGENIRIFRQQQKLTQEGLAGMLGGHKSLVSNYENGHSLPDIYVIWKLADIFDVTIDELVGREKF